MLVKDKFNDDGLFTEMSNINTLKYMELIPPESMDILYNSNNGLRILSYMGETYSVPELAKVLLDMFKNKWDTLYDLAISELPLDYNYSITEHENIDDDGTHTDDYVSTDIGQVNAYNDEDFVNDTNTDTKTANEGTNVNYRKRQLHREMMTGSKTDNLEKIKIYLQNNYFNDIIVKDVNEFLTLSIFN